MLPLLSASNLYCRYAYAFTGHTRWNLSQILEIYLTCQSVEEPVEVLGEWRQNLERNALKLTRFVTLQH